MKRSLPWPWHKKKMTPQQTGEDLIKKLTTEARTKAAANKKYVAELNVRKRDITAVLAKAKAAQKIIVTKLKAKQKADTDLHKQMSVDFNAAYKLQMAELKVEQAKEETALTTTYKGKPLSDAKKELKAGHKAETACRTEEFANFTVARRQEMAEMKLAHTNAINAATAAYDLEQQPTIMKIETLTRERTDFDDQTKIDTDATEAAIKKLQNASAGQLRAFLGTYQCRCEEALLKHQSAQEAHEATHEVKLFLKYQDMRDMALSVRAFLENTIQTQQRAQQAQLTDRDKFLVERAKEHAEANAIATPDAQEVDS